MKIVNELGLHARPAALFVETATRFKSDIMVVKDDLEINGKSIMGVLMLAAACGTELVIDATGEDCEDALDALDNLIKGKFDED